jgi:hypothetical protein
MEHGFKVMDSDLHTMEPDGLWQRYLDERFKAFAPTFTRRADNASNQPLIRIGRLEIGEMSKRPHTAAVGKDFQRRAFAARRITRSRTPAATTRSRTHRRWTSKASTWRSSTARGAARCRCTTTSTRAWPTRWRAPVAPGARGGHEDGAEGRGAENGSSVNWAFVGLMLLVDLIRSGPL